MEKINIKDAARRLGGYLLDLGMTPDEVRAKQAEIRTENERREIERKVEESARREDALKRVAGMVAQVERYHSQVDTVARFYWHGVGLSNATIERYKLGYCPACPTYRESPSYVIPYFQARQLISIRHRLAYVTKESGKYRPEFAGLPNQLFNLDALTPDEVSFMLDPGEVLLVEGEIKSLFLSAEIGLPSVGMPGVESWQEEWIKYFAGCAGVYVTLDPDAEHKAAEITRTLNANGIAAKQVTITCKPDDFFVQFGGSTADFMRILEQGRRVT
jgi:hypothetical protein